MEWLYSGVEIRNGVRTGDRPLERMTASGGACSESSSNGGMSRRPS